MIYYPTLAQAEKAKQECERYYGVPFEVLTYLSGQHSKEWFIKPVFEKHFDMLRGARTYDSALKLALR